MADAPRENLIRANLDERAAAVEGDGRTMFGYPIVFDRWTIINSWEGQFKERVAKGAANRTIKNNKNEIKVLFNHGMDRSIGDKPLGKPDVLRTDDTGVYTETPLSRTSYNEDLIALMNDGAIDGMSFRFQVLDEEWVYPKSAKALPERTIKELRLFEFGPVTFPAYQATTVGLRSAADFDRWLGLDDNKRAEIARLMGISADLRTSLWTPEDLTDHGEPANSNTHLGSESHHPTVTPINRHAALAAVARLKGVICENTGRTA